MGTLLLLHCDHLIRAFEGSKKDLDVANSENKEVKYIYIYFCEYAFFNILYIYIYIYYNRYMNFYHQPVKNMELDFGRQEVA